MEGHDVGRAVILVVAVEVLLEPAEDLIWLVVEEHTLVQVGAVASLEALRVVRVERDLPDSCRFGVVSVRLSGWWDVCSLDAVSQKNVE